MSDKDLRETISAAEEKLSQQEAVAGSMHGRKAKQSNPRLIMLVVLALLCSSVSFAMIMNASTEVQEDILAAEMDFLMEADAEIFAYYDLFEQLPFEMPDYALRNFVEYRRIDNTRFELVPLLETGVVISRNISEVIDPEQVLAQLVEAEE